MAKVLVSNENLINIANVIREKNGETTTYKPSEMASAIQNISSGGGDEELEASFVSKLDDSLGANITKLPSGLTTIRERAFYNCQNLALTELPDGITQIGLEAFYGCKNLALTKLPSSVTTIGDSCFRGCAALALTEIPAGVTNIYTNTFYGCKNITISSLPENIKKLSGYNFYSCTNITEMTMYAEKISSITNYAFRYTNLAKLVFPNITGKISLGDTTVFEGTPIANGTGYIYVPDALVDSFKTATNWSTYADQIKPISELEVNE